MARTGLARNALVLGGGAPNFTLNTGALLAFEEEKFRFDVVTGAGGGGAVALSYLAPPKGVTRAEGLRNSINLGVSDPIYRVLPMNYKVFMKRGVMAEAYRALLSRLPGYDLITNQYSMTKGQKLLSDLIQACWAITTPGVVLPSDKGLCAHAPFINAMVDFDKLKRVKEEVYISAYSLTNHQMKTFSRDEITFQHFGASLSYPFIYPPTKIDDEEFIEGASEDAFNFQGLVDYVISDGHKVDNIIVFDSFGCECYLQVPPSLWQAFGQSIISPLVALDRKGLELFKIRLEQWNAANPERQARLLVLEFPIPKGWAPTALDWSSSNLERLFELGYREGKKFLEKYGSVLRGTSDSPAA
jgi:NTE family protein